MNQWYPVDVYQVFKVDQTMLETKDFHRVSISWS